MKILGPKAMRTRRICLENIGWLEDASSASQAEWIACMVSLHGICGTTYVQMSFILGAISPQAIQLDFRNMGLVESSGIRGGYRGTKWYMVDDKKGTILQHCKRLGLKYSSVYSHMRKEMAAGKTKEEALCIALRELKPRHALAATRPHNQTQAHKIENDENDDPRSMSKKQRRAYLIIKAKQFGVWRREKKDKFI